MQNSALSPLILSGPSGVGKSYLEKHLCDHYNFQRILSTTTRPQREGEIEGQDYNFITEYEYKQREKEGRFITSVFNFNAWYGFEKSLVEHIQAKGKIPITICIPQIIDQFIKTYPTTIALYLLPENDDLLIKRMQQRGDTPERIQYRLKESKKEIEEYQKKKNYYQEELPITEFNFNETVQTIMHLYS